MSLVGATSSIPHTAATDGKTGSSVHRPPMWGGEAAPTRPMSRELTRAFMAAHRAWSKRQDQLTIDEIVQADRQRDGITLSTVPQAPPKEHT